MDGDEICCFTTEGRAIVDNFELDLSTLEIDLQNATSKTLGFWIVYRARLIAAIPFFEIETIPEMV